jgi:hypothetical protein
MFAPLREITVTCFFTSYLVVLLLELLRLLGRVPGRGLAVIVMTVVGLLVHLIYLGFRIAEPGPAGETGLLASWTDWSLLLAFGLMVCFFVFYLRRPDTIVSFFFLPLVLLLILLAVALRERLPFSRTEAAELWRTLHALSMAIGVGAVLIGFLAGSMYLLQSWRLKRRRAGSMLRLPTLESLQKLNRHCLVVSTVSVGLGVFSGVVMNLNQLGHIGWTDGGVLVSSLLFVWLLVATIVEFVYAPSSHGRKVAYLTLASFGFLVITMVALLASSHGQSSQPAPSGAASQPWTFDSWRGERAT